MDDENSEAIDIENVNIEELRNYKEEEVEE